MTRRLPGLATLVMLWAGASGVAQAGPPVKVFAPEAHLVGASKVGFGAGLSLDGDTCLIGAPGAGAMRGEATVYARNNGGVWSPLALANTTTAAKAQFGATTVVSGDAAFVGAPGEAPDGAVHVFRRSASDGAWALAQVIVAPAGSPQPSRFAVSMAFDGTTLAVGAPEESSDGTYAGRVYTYTLDAGTGLWALQATLKPTPVSSRFGISVAISGEHLVAGAVVDAQLAGKAFFFRNVGGAWQPTGAVSEPTGAKPNRYFGASVTIDQTSAFVAATSSPNAGNAGVYRYAFDGTSWAYANDAYVSGALYYGSSLRLRDGILAIGDNGTRQPRLYSASTQPTWPLLATLASPDGQLGAPVDISQDRFAVTAADGEGFVDIGTLKLGPGSDCAASDECASGFCVDGVCCDRACDAGACDACSAATGASADGTCTVLKGAACDGGAGTSGQGGGGAGGAAQAGQGGAGQAGQGGAAPVEPPAGSDDGGCGCRASGAAAGSPAALMLVGLLALGARRRRSTG